MFKNIYSILHINTEDAPGGAALVATRLSNLQAQKGHRVFQLFGKIKRKFPYRYYHLIKKITSSWSNQNPLLPFIYRFGHVYTDRIKQVISPVIKQNYRKKGLLDYEYNLQEFLLKDYFVQTSDIIHLHNLHGNYFDLFTLPVLSQLKPIIWTLHDMQAITGHCAHALSCGKWKTGCGYCPDLSIYPSIPVDSTDLLWKDKKWIYEHSNLLITTPSKWLKNKVEKSMLACHPIEVVPNSVNTNLFRPSHDKKALRKKYNLSQNNILIGCVANGGLKNPWKGGEYAVKIIAALNAKFKNVSFVEIGVHQTQSNTQTAQIAYIKNEEEMAEIYACLDIYLFTCIAENCSLVLLEALATGLSIVAFDVCSVSELIKHEYNGFLIPFADISAALYYLTLLIENTVLRNRFSKFARIFAEMYFCENKIGKQLDDIYQSLITARSMNLCR